MDNIEALAGANVPVRDLRYLINPTALGHLTSTVKFSSTASPLMDMQSESEGNVIGSIMGFPVHMSSKMQANKFILGDFSHSAWAFWGGLEISVNPFYDDRRFTQSFNAILGADFKVINASAFNIMTA